VCIGVQECKVNVAAPFAASFLNWTVGTRRLSRPLTHPRPCFHTQVACSGVVRNTTPRPTLGGLRVEQLFQLHHRAGQPGVMARRNLDSGTVGRAGEGVCGGAMSEREGVHCTQFTGAWAVQRVCVHPL
jgi:hypothetical protein